MHQSLIEVLFYQAFFMLSLDKLLGLYRYNIINKSLKIQL